MAYLPVSGADICQMMNLPSDMGDNPLWALHSSLIMGMLALYAVEEALEDAAEYTPEEPEEGEEMVIESDYYYPLRLSYSYLMLSQTAHLLNLKTVGRGIVKVVGLDNTATELLTLAELEQLSGTLEMKGLQVLGEYASEVGLARARELTPVPRRFKCGVI